MERAIESTGAFGRFRDLVHQESLADQWYAFATDRQLGRAREFLADEGIRVGDGQVSLTHPERLQVHPSGSPVFAYRGPPLWAGDENRPSSSDTRSGE